MGERMAVAAWLTAVWLVVYNGSNYLAWLGCASHTCCFAFEPCWPFVPQLILAYWSTHVLFVAAPFVCRDRGMLRQHLKRVTLGLLLAGLFFVNFPLTLPWAQPEVHGWAAAFFVPLGQLHNFYNCAPSLHILLLACLWPVYVSPLQGRARALMVGGFALGWLSTLLCWQHGLVDVATGQLLGLLCLRLVP